MIFVTWEVVRNKITQMPYMSPYLYQMPFGCYICDVNVDPSFQKHMQYYYR